jgi:biotin carboxyl carrier protein
VAEGSWIIRDEADREHRVSADSGTVTVNGIRFEVASANDGSVRVLGESQSLTWTTVSGTTRWVFLDGRVYTFEAEPPGGRRRRRSAHHGTHTAPMPATVRKVPARVGDTVRRGDVLIVLEAMKMELPVRATSDGRVTAIHCAEGDLVQPGVSLIEIDG